MQDKTGTLNPGAHPESYNGQDAYNDMLVVDDGYKYEQSKLSLHSEQGQSGNRRCGRSGLVLIIRS